MKIQFLEKLIVSHLDVNSIRKKFDSLSFMTENNVDILLISETKLDDSFLSGQFKICGFSMPYQYDRDSMGDGLLLFIRDYEFITNIENLSVQINFRKRKWFFNGSYNPHKNKISSHLNCLNDPRKNKISNHVNYLNLVCIKYNKVNLSLLNIDDLIFMSDLMFQ